MVSTGLFIFSFIASGNVEQKQAIIDAGCLAYFMKFINSWYPEIRSESINALTEICNGTSEQCEKVLDVRFIPALTTFLDMLMAPLDLESLHLCKNLMDICMKSPEEARIKSAILPLLETTFKLKICDTNPETEKEEYVQEVSVAENVEELSEAIKTIYSTDLVLCEKAVLTIKNFASESIEKRQKIIDAHLIPRLIECLKFTDLNVYIKAAGALGNIANGTIEQTQVVIDTGAISPLLNLLDDIECNPEKLRTALFALGNISDGTKEQKQAIIDANAIPYIYMLFKSSDSYIPVLAIRILVHLTSDISQQPITIEAEILFQLKNLLSTANRNLCFVIACLVSNLSAANVEQRQFIAYSGIVTSLIECLEKFSKDFFKNREPENFKKSSEIKAFNIEENGSNISDFDMCFIFITALQSLSITELGQTFLNVISLLTKFLKKEYMGICEKAVFTLTNLGNTEKGKKLVATKSINSLVRLLESPEFVYCVTRALMKISTGEEERELIIQSGCLSALVDIIKFQNFIKVENRHDIEDKANKKEENAPEDKKDDNEFITLSILEGQNLNICINAINTFGNISLGIPNGANLVSENVPMFVKLLDSPNTEIQNASAFVISNLSKGLPCHIQSILDAGAIEHLITLLFNTDTFENAANAIVSLTHEITGVQAVIKSGAIGTLVKAIDSPFRFYATIILNNISNGGENEKQSLIDAGAVPIMIKCFDYSNPEICGPLFAALQSLIAGNDKQRQFVVECGVIPCLIQLLNIPNIKPLSLNTLATIAAGTNDEKERLVQAGVIELFISNMVSTNDRSKNAAVAGILHLAAGTIEHIDAIIKANAIPQLFNLLNSADSLLRKYATFAIANISEGNIEQKEAIIEGTPSLIKLLEDIDKQTSEEAARALKNLIKGTKHGMEIIIQKEATLFILRTLTNENVNTRKHGEEALKYILLFENVEDATTIHILEELKKELESISKTYLTLFRKICQKLVEYDFIKIIKNFTESENEETKTHAIALFQLINEKYINANLLCIKYEESCALSEE
uniref:Uncharacterized protein n=1 Tax=Panagrolaimus davidi TaxID=227884 RepID=A0A914P074_9BILA